MTGKGGKGGRVVVMIFVKQWSWKGPGDTLPFREGKVKKRTIDGPLPWPILQNARERS